MRRMSERLNQRICADRQRPWDFQMPFGCVNPSFQPVWPVFTHNARPTGSFGVAASVSWAGMALPLAACVAIWGIGNAAPTTTAWLSIVHGVIGAAASAWTALRLVMRRRVLQGAHKARPSWPGASLLALYALMALQPVLAVTASMLHGNTTTLFDIPLPSVLPADPLMAFQVDRLHGCNAVLLLGLIAMHIENALQGIYRQRSAPELETNEGPARR